MLGSTIFLNFGVVKMQAIILAAGMGKRLGRYTKDATKCMVEVNGKALIEYAIEALVKLPSAERLNAQYIGADNQKHHPVMLHRAVLGSLERFMGILIENYAGVFPTWLCFEQVAVVPVSPDFNDYAQKVADELLEAGIKVNAYLEDDNMKNKIKDISTAHRTPYILVVGEANGR